MTAELTDPRTALVFLLSCIASGEKLSAEEEAEIRRLASSGSPSVPAAQPKDQANHMAPTREVPAPLASLAEVLEVIDAIRAIAIEQGALHVGAPDWLTTIECHALVASQDLRAFSVEPRAAPSPALPREAPEPGGTLAERMTPEELAAVHRFIEEAREHPHGLGCGNIVAQHIPLPRAAPSDSAPATPGLGPPSAGSPDPRKVTIAELEALLAEPDGAYDVHILPDGKVISRPRCRLVKEHAAEPAPSSPESPAQGETKP